jgi:hypothetical protein
MSAPQTASPPVLRALDRSPSAGFAFGNVELACGLLYENFIGTSGVVLRKQLLTEIDPFDESTAYAEDRDL